jgi:hypothetical protein
MAQKRTLAAIAGLVLALGAVSALAFVLAEPVSAIESLRDDPGDFSAQEQRDKIGGRLHEAGGPLVAASIAGALALVVALIARQSGLGAAAIFVACLALAGAAYVWARYGQGISAHL